MGGLSYLWKRSFLTTRQVSTRELGEEYGASKSTINSRLVKQGNFVIRGGKFNLPVDQIISDYQSGMTPKSGG